jgi:tripartite ATP-independent transporter DctM subunit
MAAEDLLVIAMLATFLLGLLSGFPVAWVLGGVGVLFAGVGYLSDLYLGTVTGLDFLTLGLVVNRIYRLMDNWVLVALPLFVFMGLMLDRSGVAQRLMVSMQALLGPLRGGLALTATVIGLLLAASTGIIGASVVLLGLLTLPAMLRQGYDRHLALGTVAGAGTLGILVPPSIMLVVMADQLGLPVGDLFMGAVFPGLILAGLYAAYIVTVGLLRPAAAPLPADRAPISWATLGAVARDVVPPALLIVAVLGSIFTGIATATEASGVGALGALLLAAGYRRLDRRVLGEVLRGTFETAGYIFAIFLGATCFALVLRELGGDAFIEGLFTDLPFGDHGTLAAMLGVVFLLGLLLDWIEITLIVLPLLAPVVDAMDLALNGHGVIDDPTRVWFALLVAVALQTSFLTPPVGFALFYLRGVCPPEVRLKDIYRGVLPFIALQLLGLAIVAAFPQLALWLPAVTYD